jgi:hypothetical protein
MYLFIYLFISVNFLKKIISIFFHWFSFFPFGFLNTIFGVCNLNCFFCLCSVCVCGVGGYKVNPSFVC